MPDMLVKLYEIKEDWNFLSDQEKLRVIIRKPIGSEKHLVVDWVRNKFSDAWASETDIAISNTPTTCFIAVKDSKVIGFACYDATALGFFGPIGVEESCRNKGTGKALLLACILDMKLKGYGYAVIGQTNKSGFYHRILGATEIPDSTPGLWETWLKTN